ncbi:hypothetical protein BB558_007406 [Smittium angustum]|uniref:Uncharacterized protein n=1 Tax=Smittium angustum TaxID=133377 RepID=A0A2U1IV40_SMIAN|nr:hypothetical protein BB558_007406 [Smittium angustum]
MDTLVNNATNPNPFEELSKISNGDLARHFEVNLFSALYLTQIALLELIKPKEKVKYSFRVCKKFFEHLGELSFSKISFNMMNKGFPTEVPEVTILAFRQVLLILEYRHNACL